MTMTPPPPQSRVSTLVVVWWTVVFLPCVAKARNMNGVAGQYKIANGLVGVGSPYNTDYQAEYFEVYSDPIKTLYSQVFWAGTTPVPLPPDIVERFANKTMAVVGYEVDQVFRSNVTGGKDVSVPITHAYNHHYCSWLVNSRKARLVQTKATEKMVRLGLTHGSDYHWVPELLDDVDENDNNVDPMVQFFSEGNGGEFRLSYHGFPKGYAQLIQSPDYFHIAPMQIDTWNRDEPSPKYKPGPLPKSSQIPADIAGYSPLLECPCSNRIHKEWNMTYELSSQGDCPKPVQSQTECYSSVHQVLQASVFRFHNDTNTTTKSPSGCSFVQHADGTTDVYWNSATSNPPPFTDTYALAAAELLETDQDFYLDYDDTAMTSSTSNMVAFASGQINITVTIKAGTDNEDEDNSNTSVVITMVGPSDLWFGVGFGTNTMCKHMQSDQCPDGGPYTIIVQGDHVEERQLGYHGPGTVLSPTIQVRSNDILNGNRTVVVTRSRHGAAYTFDTSNNNLDIITARGCGMEFAQHCGHGPAQLRFVQMETPTQICQAGIQGTIQGRKFYEEGRCPSFPEGDLISNNHFNPTCKIETYRGGLYCCNHGQFLLDKEQEIPWNNQYLTYHLKFRFYFEEYQPAAASSSNPEKSLSASTASSALAAEIDSSNGDEMEEESRDRDKPSHQNLVRLFWATEGNAGEYDILPCHNNTPVSQCVQVITARVQVRDLLHDCGTHIDASYCTGHGSTDPAQTQGVKLIYAGPHCHAPACLSMELYHANTGQLLCHVEPIYGESDDEVYNEHGYLAIPPCLWGDSEEGLAHPVLLPLDAELLSIKRNNNTFPHTGDMALWQMRGAVVPNTNSEEETKEQSVMKLLADDEPSTSSSLRHGRREGN